MIKRIYPRIEVTASDLTDPAFLRFVERQFPIGGIVADPEDFNPLPPEPTDAQRIEVWKRAIARKLVRMCREWKAAQN
jgi:hypothetical protein